MIVLIKNMIKLSLGMKMGIHQKIKIMLFAGLIRPYKGIDNLLNGTKKISLKKIKIVN